MYPLSPLKTYALERVYDDPQSMRRMQRILDATGVSAGEVIRITDGNLPDVVAELAKLWPPESVPPGTVRSCGLRSLVCNSRRQTRRREYLGGAG